MALLKFDPADAIILLAGLRVEKYPLERELVLLGFVAWMHWPDDFATIKLVQSVGAAHLYTVAASPLEKHIADRTPALSRDSLARDLVSYSQKPLGPLSDLFMVAASDADQVSDIVSFFVHCPADRRPSLLKALFFIDEGGFVPEDLDGSDPEFKIWKRSATTSKAAWSQRARTGPFLWTATHLNYTELFNVSPDRSASLARLKKCAADHTRLLKFYRHALFVQNLVKARIDPQTIKRHKFVSFPKQLLPLDPKLGSFAADQLAILDRYRAPKTI